MERSKRMLALFLCVLACLPTTFAFMSTASPASENEQMVAETVVQPAAETVAEPAVDTATQTEESAVSQPVLQTLATEQVNTEKQSGPITTDMIQAVCDKYGYHNGKYWCIYENDGLMVSGNRMGNYLADRENGCSVRMATVNYRLDAGDHPVQSGDYYKSYNYANQYECHGFACYVMAKVVQKRTGRNNDVIPRMGSRNGWKRIEADEATDLQVGDIVRVEDDVNQHSAVVYSIDKKGRATFLESGGGASCAIRLGKGFNFLEGLDTLEKIRSRYTLEYVYRYTGK